MLCVLGNMNGKIYTQIALSGRTDNAKCGSLKGAEGLKWKVM